MVATEQASWHLPPDQGERLRAEMIGALCSAKPPRSNVSKGERQAIDELKKLKDIVILPADKGKATVILDKEEYMSKVKLTLSDTKTYETLKKDPTPTYKRQLVGILNRLKQEEKNYQSAV